MKRLHSYSLLPSATVATRHQYSTQQQRIQRMCMSSTSHQYYINAFICRIFYWQACSSECKMSESFRAWHQKNFICFTIWFFFVYLMLLMLVWLWNVLEWLRCLPFCLNIVFFFSGKTELAKQVARYMHKDIKKVWESLSHLHTHAHTHSCLCLVYLLDVELMCCSHKCKAQENVKYITVFKYLWCSSRKYTLCCLCSFSIIQVIGIQE